MTISTKAGPLPDLCSECKRFKKREKKKEERKARQTEKRTAICSLCGREYVRDSGRSDRCPECRFSIRGINAKKAEIVKEKKPGRMAETIQRAKGKGVSYGKYVALMNAIGYVAQETAAKNIAWESWKKHIYEIVEQGKKMREYENESKRDMPVLHGKRRNER